LDVATTPFTKLLALWIILAGICLALCEQIQADILLNRLLDSMDALFLQEVAAQEYRFFKGGGKGRGPGPEEAKKRGFGSNPDAEDIQRSITRRKEREAAERAARGEPEPGDEPTEEPEGAKEAGGPREAPPPKFRAEAARAAQPQPAGYATYKPQRFQPWMIVVVFLVPILGVMGYLMARKPQPSSPDAATTSNILNATPMNAAGTWTGYVQWGGKKMNAVLTLSQSGANVIGTLVESLDGPPAQSATIRVTGQVTGETIELQETSLADHSYQTSWCLVPGDFDDDASRRSQCLLPSHLGCVAGVPQRLDDGGEALRIIAGTGLQ
jgi:hypothetical protein